MASYETVLCVKNEVFVFKIPPRSTNRGYRAAEWKLDNPDWTGRMKIVSQGSELNIRLEDKNNGDLFAKCPVECYPSTAVEQVLDSSRYFVLRIQDGTGRNAFIGIGFADRGDSFDLMVALQDHFKWLKREEQEKKDESKSKFDTGPKLDLGFKEGQTIRINLQTKKTEDGESPPSRRRNRAQGGSTLGLLPPPPGGVKIAPPRAAQTTTPQAVPMFSQPAPPSGGTQAASNTDLLFDIEPPSQSFQPLQPQAVAPQPAGGDPWGDFTASGGSSSSTGSANQSDSSGGGWVNFE